ncbi:MAG: hypothetical protein MJ072_06245, partial [Clostridia bacterium]|nr:hypothetical protein [Clostridia bacterium]
GYESKHNLNYGTRGEYIGVGVSASSLIDGRRFTNTFSLGEYMNLVILGKNPEVTGETLSAEDEMFETVMLGLRTEKGISVEKFEKQFGVNFFEYFKDSLSKNEEYLSVSDGFVAVKPEYMYVENGIIVDFMKD